MVNTGLRPDEAARLEFRDVEIVKDEPPAKPFWKSAFAANEGSDTARACRVPCLPFERLREA